MSAATKVDQTSTCEEPKILHNENNSQGEWMCECGSTFSKKSNLKKHLSKGCMVHKLV